MAERLTKVQYARTRRERGLPGVTRQAVENAINDGRIHLEEDGQIDPKRADREWEDNTDPQRRSEASGQLASARAVKATMDARLAQLEYEKKLGEVIKVVDVERLWFELVRRVRDRLMTVGARLAGELASEDDARVITQRIEEEIIEALTGLSRRPGGNGKG